MALPIPTLSDIVVIKEGDKFRHHDNSVVVEVTKLLSKGKRFMGTVILAHKPDDSFCILIANRGTQPAFFMENMAYLEGSPLPHCINPVYINNYVVYEIEIL